MGLFLSEPETRDSKRVLGFDKWMIDWNTIDG